MQAPTPVVKHAATSTSGGEHTHGLRWAAQRCVAKAVVRARLLLSGDVELNPGPPQVEVVGEPALPQQQAAQPHTPTSLRTMGVRSFAAEVDQPLLPHGVRSTCTHQCDTTTFCMWDLPVSTRPTLAQRSPGPWGTTARQMLCMKNNC
jgi:hypothetical protein